MAHFDLFRAQIERIVLLRRDLDRDALLDLDAEAVQTEGKNLISEPMISLLVMKLRLIMNI